MVALLITYLTAMYSAFQRREEMEGIGCAIALLTGLLQVKCLPDGAVEGGIRIESKKSHGEI